MSIHIMKEKIAQIPVILKEKNIDLWLTFVRESDTIKDPAMDIFIDRGVTWQSAFIFAKNGEKIVIVGSLDADNIKDSGLFEDIRTYVASIKDTLKQTICELNPETIAINRSSNDVMSDGLTCGMFEILSDTLKGTGFEDKFVSSEPIISALRGRKTKNETEKIKKAVEITEEIFDMVTKNIKPGMTEKEVAEMILNYVKKRGLTTAWDSQHCPGVFATVEAAAAHASPSDRKITKGSVMHIDFGVKYEGYCSDLQRTWYFLADNETQAPLEVKKAFETVRDSIKAAFDAIKPGIEGRFIDKISRDYIIEQGYEEYPHALGHQVGKSTHDGAGLLCPEWERYGNLPYLKIEEGQIYTLEPRINLNNYGAITMEEIIKVGKDGAEFLSNPQTELILIDSA